MGSGAGIGYPDWQRYSNFVGAPLVPPQQIDVLPATQTFGPFAVAQWESILVTVNNGGHHLKLVIDSTPRNGSVAVQQEFDLVQNGQTQFVFPNRSDQVKLLLSSPLASVPSPDTIDWSVHPCNLPEGMHVTANPAGIITKTLNQVVAAGGNFVFTLPFYFGPANVIIGQCTQVSRLFMTPEDASGGALSQVVIPIAANSVLNTIIYVPGNVNVWQFFNDGGAAETVSVLVVAPAP